MSSVPQTPLDKAAVDMSIGVVARTVALKAKNNNRSVPEYLGTTRHASVADPDSLLILPQVAKAYREALAGSTDAVPAGWTADDVAAARAFLRIADAAPGTAEISRESLAPLYPHATTVTTPNFGSFGGAPLPVTAVQHAIQQALVDGDVDHFLRLRLFADLEDSHRAVAQLMGLPNTKNITFCDNAADGFNIIAQSVIFNPVFYKKLKGEAVGPGGAPEPLRIMMMSNAYPMTKTAVAFWINRHLDLRDALGPAAAASLWSYEVTQCPLTEEMVLSLNNETPTALIDGIADRAIACKADVVLIDHVAFAPAFIVPVDAICRKIKAANPKCFIILDAAHAIGAIDLKPHFGAATPPPFDAWFSNLHKWLMAPKHLAVLWHSDDYADYFHPNTISNLYRGVPYDDLVAPSHNGPRNRVDILRGMGILYDCQDPAAQRRAEFFWRGTRDHSCALVIPELLWFRRQFGEERIRAHNNRLAFDAAATMGKIWGTELLIRRSEHLSSMANVALPENSAALVQRAITLLLTKHAINLPVFPLGDKMYARISGQVFNDAAVYETVARAVLACFEEVKANP